MLGPPNDPVIFFNLVFNKMAHASTSLVLVEKFVEGFFDLKFKYEISLL